MNRISQYEFDKIFFDRLIEVIDEKYLLHIEYVKPGSASDDNYLNTEIGLISVEDGGLHFVVLKLNKINNEVQPIGIDKNNPILDTRFYEL